MKKTTSIILAMSMGALAAGCAEKVPELVTTASVRPPDQVDPRALAEGPLKLLGLPMPVDTMVDESNPLVAIADVPYPFERVETFLRQRIESTSSWERGVDLTFENATIKGSPGAPAIHVVLTRFGTSCRVAVAYAPSSHPQPPTTTQLNDEAAKREGVRAPPGEPMLEGAGGEAGAEEAPSAIPSASSAPRSP